MNTLFNDSEVFQKDRPKKLTDNQQSELYKELAQEIIDSGWSSSEVEDIVEDLKTLSRHDSGFELAKELEGFRCNADYDIKTDFIEWLDDFDSRHTEVISENEMRWVKAHSIKPAKEIGIGLLINKSISRSEDLRAGCTIYINGYYEKTGKYQVWKEKGSKRNYIINYEEIDECCSFLPVNNK